MSTLKSALTSHSVALPYRVRLAPYFVESICELARLVRDKGNHQHSEISGLVFGKVEAGVRTAEALKAFDEAGTHSELARRERWEKAYKATLEESKADPELAAFEMVGWFSFRNGSGLLSSDVAFHNQNFRKPEDVALIIWREGPSQITVEVYSKAENDNLSSDDYRWGSVRLSADIKHMREPIDLPMRVKLSDDSYLRTYDDGAKPSALESFKHRAGAASGRLLGAFFKRKEDEFEDHFRSQMADDEPPANVPLPPAPVAEPAPPPPAAAPTFNEPSFGRSKREMAEARKAAAQIPAHLEQFRLPAPSRRGLAAPAPVSTDSGMGLAAAPARSLESQAQRSHEAVPPAGRSEMQLADTRFPTAVTPVSPVELSAIGRAPRSGRMPYPEISGLPMVIPPKVETKAFPWGWSIVLFVVCSALVFAFLAMGGLQGDGGRLGQVVGSIFPGGELDLKVRNQDERLLLSWNQRNRAVASARDATLQITDGTQHRDIHLDGRQVMDGSVLYRPLSNDVTFLLEVHSETGVTSGSVRVLDSGNGKQPVLDVSAPASATIPQQQIPATQPQLNDPALASGTPTGTIPGSSAEGVPPVAGSEALAGKAAASPIVPPITETPMTTPAGETLSAAKPAGKRKTPSSRYETPQTIRTITPVPVEGGNSGTTINSWDPASIKRGKQRAVAPAPVFPTVSSGAATSGYVAPRPLMQVMPNTRALPAGTIQARTSVEVQVDVDKTGRVEGARLVSAGVNEKISSAALSAARRWTFEPASNNGQHVNSVHTILFEFRPEQAGK